MRRQLIFTSLVGIFAFVQLGTAQIPQQLDDPSKLWVSLRNPYTVELRWNVDPDRPYAMAFQENGGPWVSLTLSSDSRMQQVVF